jgi:hypothetical protein
MKKYGILIIMSLFLFSCAGGSTSGDVEICDNSLDDDGDGKIDCLDADCNSFAGCSGTEICDNNQDDDGDLDVDCADSDCFTHAHCTGASTETSCTDNIDNDGDLDIDCADSDCVNHHTCIDEICDNNQDDDGDGDEDCYDSECTTHANCLNPTTEISCIDGVDNDGDDATDCLDIDCVDHHSCIDEICDNNNDDDGDGDEDCADTECTTHHSCITEICDNNTDDDGDGDEDCDDDECTAHANCTGPTTETSCTDGIDNDGDLDEDCDDSECSSTSECVCKLEYVYSDQHDSCEGNYQCGVDYNSGFDIVCRSDTYFSGGTIYGACGASDSCPFGSWCHISYDLCFPICDYVEGGDWGTVKTCPPGGKCRLAYGINGLPDDDGVGFCHNITSCDPIDQTGCQVGEQCIFNEDETFCQYPEGTVVYGGDCSTGDGCASGLICITTSANLNYPHPSTCLNVCENPGGADPICSAPEACGSITDENIWGVCIDNS